MQHIQNKVLMILMDGVRPDSLPLCGDGGYLDGLFRSGTYTMEAETVYPPVTLPVHLSIFYGKTPEEHGTLDNRYVPDRHPTSGLVEWVTERAKTFSCFYTWEELRTICRPGDHMSFSWYMGQHVFPFPEIEKRETEEAVRHIAEFEPDAVFLYLGGADVMGHLHGWMSEPYLEEIRQEALCIERILRDLPDTYSVLITADHGGHSDTHGENIPEDMKVPLAVIGGCFQPGRRFRHAGVLDIAPTVSELLGIDPNPEWEGRSLIHAETD